MKKIAFGMTLLLASVAAAQAPTSPSVVTPATYQPVAAKPLRFVPGAGLTAGGDKIATAYYDDGDELEYLATPWIGVTLRYANDEFEEKRYDGKLKGDHVGAFANFYF